MVCSQGQPCQSAPRARQPRPSRPAASTSASAKRHAFSRSFANASGRVLPVVVPEADPLGESHIRYVLKRQPKTDNPTTVLQYSDHGLGSSGQGRRGGGLSGVRSTGGGATIRERRDRMPVTEVWHALKRVLRLSLNSTGKSTKGRISNGRDQQKTRRAKRKKKTCSGRSVDSDILAERR